jgi:hypothetical protein
MSQEVEVKLAKAKVFGSTFFNVTAEEWGGSMCDGSPQPRGRLRLCRYCN